MKQTRSLSEFSCLSEYTRLNSSTSYADPENSARGRPDNVFFIFILLVINVNVFQRGPYGPYWRGHWSITITSIFKAT